MLIELRPYQSNLQSGIFESWNQGHKNVLAVSPTGSGKAFTLMDTARKLCFEYGRPVTIIVHRKELVAQLCMTAATLGIEHNIIAQTKTVTNIISEQQQEFKKSFYLPRSPITIVSVDTLLSRKERYREWGLKQMIWIQDEAAHQLKNNKWGQVVELFPNALGVGFTATPQRLDKRGLGRHAFGLYDTMVLGPTVRWLIDNGFLSKYKVIIPPSDYEKYLVDNGNSTSDYTQKARAVASAESHITGDVVEQYLKHIAGKRFILFADCIAAGERIEKNFIDAGVPVKFLHGETPDAERNQGVRDYRTGKILGLINVDLFDEGFDVPGTDAVIMARKTKSLGKYLQMCGRALRPSKTKPFAFLIDHVGNIREHLLPDSFRTWTLDNIVKKRDTISLHRNCLNITCNLPFDRWLAACPFCGCTDKAYTRNPTEMTAREALKIVDGDLELLDPETIRALESSAILEDPIALGHRVRGAAGDIAAKRAIDKQYERIETQKKLAELIAKWAGKQRHHGYTDRQIKKRFMMEFNEGISVALSLPTADMNWYIAEIEGSL